MPLSQKMSWLQGNALGLHLATLSPLGPEPIVLELGGDPFPENIYMYLSFFHLKIYNYVSVSCFIGAARNAVTWQWSSGAIG